MEFIGIIWTFRDVIKAIGAAFIILLFFIGCVIGAIQDIKAKRIKKRERHDKQ